MCCILDQRHVKHIRYGLFKSDYNGCSWVAAYNALCLLKHDYEPQKIARHFEKYLPLWGLLGMPFSSFLKALKGLDIKFKRVSVASHEAKTADACVLWYRKQNLKAHYCAIQYIDDVGVFRYLNPTAKAQPLREFLNSVGAVESEIILFE